MKTYLAILTVVLVGCVTTNVKSPISGQRIGVFYSLDQEMSLCHRHAGLTAFGNFEKRYPVKEDIGKIVSRAYVKGVNSTDNTAVEISEGPNFSALMKFSFWNAVPILSPEGVSSIKKMGKIHNIDYLMVPWGFKEDSDGSVCLGPLIITGESTSSPFIPVYIALVFDATSGRYVGNTQIRNNDHPFKFIPPNDVDQITEAEISRYVNRTGEVAEKAVKVFLSGGGRHM